MSGRRMSLDTRRLNRVVEESELLVSSTLKTWDAWNVPCALESSNSAAQCVQYVRSIRVEATLQTR